MKNKNTIRIIIGFLLVLGALAYSVFVLKNLKSILLTKSNLEQEIEKATKDTQTGGYIKKMLTDTQSVKGEFIKHTIKGERDIPRAIETIESYAFNLGLPIDISTISVLEEKPEIEVVKTSPVEDTAAKSAPVAPVVEKDIPLVLDISSYGDFKNISAFVHAVESSPYVVVVPKFALRQVRVYKDPVSGRTSMLPVLTSAPSGGVEIKGFLAWSLSMRLELYPYEK